MCKGVKENVFDDFSIMKMWNILQIYITFCGIKQYKY